MTGADQLVDFAMTFDPADVPEEVDRLARLHFLDAIGVGLAASAGPDQAGWTRATSGPGTATTLDGGSATPPEAAMLNGALIHSLEYDDTHIGSVIHGSAVAAPLALAAAEQAGGNAGDVMSAYVLAWESMIRIGAAVPGAFQARGAQVTAVAGAIGAALGAGRVAGLDRKGLTSAIGIAGMQASGLLAFLEDGSSVKALNPGWAAHTGLTAVRLAAAGMTGPSGILEHRFGPLKVFGADPDQLAPQLSDLGQVWHLRDAAFKLYPCCHYIHPFLELVEDLARQGLTAESVESRAIHVTVEEAPLIAEPWSRRQAPASGYDGKWGLPYCLALRLVDGALDVSSFEAEPRDDVIALARRMRMIPVEGSGFPARFPARIEVTLTDGAKRDVSVDTVRGAPGRAIAEDEVLAKFRANAVRRFGSEQVDQLIYAGLAMDVAALVHCLRT